ncbi:response regulator [Candidatus Kaiserbacteria bacterium]|nr:response regulator [Candidatus Kaiserbacteria bacterium]
MEIMKLLLVDDDAFIRDMYATKFAENGHDVEVAKNGEVALELLERGTFDGVLLDMVMPGMTGVELITKIKEKDPTGGPACIVLSNQGEEHEIELAMQAGAKGYIIKAELIPSEVVAQVKELLQ